MFNGVRDIKEHRFFKGFDWNALESGITFFLVSLVLGSDLV